MHGLEYEDDEEVLWRASSGGLEHDYPGGAEQGAHLGDQEGEEHGPDPRDLRGRKKKNGFYLKNVH